MPRGQPLISDKALKSEILSQLSCPEVSIPELASKYNLPKRSLYEWRKRLHSSGTIPSSRGNRFVELSPPRGDQVLEGLSLSIEGMKVDIEGKISKSKVVDLLNILVV